MKKHVLLIPVLLSAWFTQAQTVSIEYLLTASPKVINKYEVGRNFHSVRLNMPFANDSILNPGVIRLLEGKTVLQVDLVYTVFRESMGFSQPALNGNRLARLKKLKPELFTNSAINWNVYAQTGCHDPESCKDFFHGIVIYYYDLPKKEEVEAERRYLEKSTERVIIGYDTFRRKKTRITERYYQPWLPSKQKNSIKYHTPGIWRRREVVVKETFYIPVVKPVYGYSATGTALSPPAFMSYGYDTVVTGVLNRNKSWKDIIVVMDVTGSMSPYTWQVMSWMALNQNVKKVRSFTFFNDGDAQSDRKKKVGETGGVYFEPSNDQEKIMKLMKYSMSKGSGGDSPENDVEAILKTVNNHPNCKEVVLIADNMSNMRDIELMNQIKVPVRIILCGSTYGVNAQYLKLARATGGSIHTMEEDLYDLFQMNEGQTVTLGKQTFMIREGEFTLVR